jgi:hypothetical protein
MKFDGFSKLAFALALTATQGLAQAGTISFNEATCQSGTVTASGLTCGTSVAGANYSATLSAWSAQTGSKFVGASMVYYPSFGLGITSPGESTVSPDHAVDNAGPTEAFLINFNSSNFALNQLSIGWMFGDADVSILRYTGTQAPVLGSRTVADLKSAAGWDWVGDYSALSTSATMNFNNTGTVKTASWWLVSAYDSGYSGKAATTPLSNDNDYFKLSGFGGSIVTPPPIPTTSVPEPGTFALFAVALAGFAGARRKSKAK